MNTIDSAQPPHQDDFALPEFLGCLPDKGPGGSLQRPWSDFCCIRDKIQKLFPTQNPNPSDAQRLSFGKAFASQPLDAWRIKISVILTDTDQWGPSVKKCWEALIHYLEPDPSPSQEKVKDLQDPWGKKKSTTSHPVRSPGEDSQDPWERKKITTSHPVQSLQDALSTALPFISPQPLTPTITKYKTPIAPKEKKKFPKFHPPPILQNLYLKTPNPKTYFHFYSRALEYCYNKYSRRGRKVYPYGQTFLCEDIGCPTEKTKDGRTIPGSTFKRIWAWHVKQGIFNKAWNENREAHRCAGWYVCTSLKQIVFFRDPQNRRRKSGFQFPPFPSRPPYTNRGSRRTPHF